jgi:predicted  nucleic acid-binding Zn-ribbon protein
MEYSEAIVGFVSGIAAAIAPRFFKSKKEKADHMLNLINTLQKEVMRVHEEIRLIRKEYDDKMKRMQSEYDSLMRDHTSLKEKYNSLKTELDKYKQQK